MNTDSYPDYVVYGLIVCASMTALMAVLRSEMAGALWFGVIPILCVSFLLLTKTKVGFSWSQLVTDLGHYWKILVLFEVMAMASALSNEYTWRVLGQTAKPGFSLGFLVTNIVEELLFRVTGIAALELLERRLFGTFNQTRVVALASVVYAVTHLPTLSGFYASYYPFAGETLKYLTLPVNLAVPFFLGMLLGNVYSRSHNLLSSLVIHWGINLSVRICRFLVSFLMTGILTVSR